MWEPCDWFTLGYCDCEDKRIDVVIVLDSSGSIGIGAWAAFTDRLAYVVEDVFSRFEVLIIFTQTYRHRGINKCWGIFCFFFLNCQKKRETQSF